MPVKSLAIGALGVSIFGIGWETGRVMSPYYAATPIVFQDQQPAAGGEEGTLQGLLSPTPTSQASSDATANIQGKFVASKNSTLFHDTSCAAAKSIKPENQVWFNSIDQARAAGYSPSSCTQKLYNIK